MNCPRARAALISSSIITERGYTLAWAAYTRVRVPSITVRGCGAIRALSQSCRRATHAAWLGILVFAFATQLAHAQTVEIDLVKQLAETATEQGDYATAATLSRQVVDLTIARFGQEHHYTGQAMHNLAVHLTRVATPAIVERTFTKSIAILEKAVGADHPDTSVARGSLGRFYEQTGNFLKARDQYKRDLDIMERTYGPDHQLVEQSSLALAHLLSAVLSENSEAEKLYQRSLRIRQRYYAHDSLEMAELYDHYSGHLNKVGRLSEAEAMMRQSIAIYEKSGDPGLLSMAISNLGVLYLFSGLFEDAEVLLTSQLRQATELQDLPRMANAHSNLSLLYRLLKRIDDANKHAQMAVQIYRDYSPSHPMLGLVLVNAARSALDANNADEAEPLAQESIKILEAQLGERNENLLEPLLIKAEVQRKRGQWKAAAELLNRALNITRERLGDAHYSIASILVELARVHYGQRNWAMAFSLYQAAEDISAKHRTLSRNTLLQQEHNIINPTNAPVELSKSAYRLWLSSKEGKAELGVAAFTAAQSAHISKAANAIGKLANRGAADNYELSALVRERQDLVGEWNSREKVRIATLSLPAQQRDESYRPEHENRLAEIQRRIAEIDRRFRRDFPQYAALIDPAPLAPNEVQRLLRDDEALILFLATPELYPSQEETLVWAVTREAVRWVRIPFGTAALTDKVQALRCGLDNDEWEGIGRPARCARLLGLKRRPRLADPLPFHLGIAHELYQALLEPVEDLIKDKHLLIVPSGPLTSLPFQVLVTTPPTSALPDTFDGYKGVAWLGRRQPLTILPSVASLQALRKFAKVSTGEKPYLGYGNPTLMGDGTCRGAITGESCTLPQVATAVDGHVRGREHSGPRSGSIDRVYRKGAGQQAVIAEIRALCPLPDTAFELRCVAKSLGVPESEIRLGASSTEADIKRLNETHDLESYRIVHFATHGLLAGDTEVMARRQGEPALVMTPPDQPNDTEDDGLLTASEVAQLKLNADWVILSACNTAAGEKIGAEALSGLARAFFYAGARTLLVSHWPVYSDAAVQILDHAFAELRQNQTIGRSEALRRAIVALMEDPRQEDNPHPSIWAPFSIVGEGAQ